MRRYLQTLGRMLYTRSKPQKPANTAAAEPEPILQSPLALRSQEPQACPKPWLRLTPVIEDTWNLPDVEIPPLPFVAEESAPAASKEPCLKEKESELVEKPEKSEPRRPLLQSTFEQLFHTTKRSAYKPSNKVTVVGAGNVGMATVFSLLSQGVTNDISIVDFNEDKLKGELMDLQFGSKFLPNARICAGKDYAISSESKICVLAPCAEAEEADDCADPKQCNAEMLKAIVPQLLKYSPDTILLVAIEPVDVLSYLTWRVSGLPKSRVMGTGTNLYSATFRYLLANRLGLAPSACKGYIIGENGESCVAVWSGVTVGGVHLRELNPNIGTDEDPENWAELHRQVLSRGQEVCALKGSSSWATALSIADICAAIIRDTNCIRPLSTYVKGEHRIREEVYLSLPCVVGGAGVTDVLRQPLSERELEQLQRCADSVAARHAELSITA